LVPFDARTFCGEFLKSRDGATVTQYVTNDRRQIGYYLSRNGQQPGGSAEFGHRLMLKQAIPNVFVKDFQAALVHYTDALGFHPLFVYGDVPFYAHLARDEAILAIRHVSKPVIDHTAGEALLSAFIEVSDVNALYEQLQTAGARIWQAPRDEPWAMRSLIVSDLDGNLICFASNLAVES
jgi:uncharacterized glyoxalase superfamily protein PhnB